MSRVPIPDFESNITEWEGVIPSSTPFGSSLRPQEPDGKTP